MSENVELQTLKRTVHEAIRRGARSPEWRDEDPVVKLRARDRVIDGITALVTADAPIGNFVPDWGDDGE